MTDRPPHDYRPDDRPATCRRRHEDRRRRRRPRRRVRRRRLRRRRTTTATTSTTSEDYVELRRESSRRPTLPHGRWSCCCSSSRSCVGARGLLGAAPDRPAGRAGRAAGARDPRGLDLRRHRQAARRRGDHRQRLRVGAGTSASTAAGPFQAGTYELADEQRDRRRDRRPRRRPGADRGALASRCPRGSRSTEILDRLADPEEGLGFDRATLQQLHGQRPDPLVGPAGRPAVQRGDPLPGDLPDRGRRRRGGRAPQAGRPARDA